MADIWSEEKDGYIKELNLSGLYTRGIQAFAKCADLGFFIIRCTKNICIFIQANKDFLKFLFLMGPLHGLSCLILATYFVTLNLFTIFLCSSARH